MRFEPAPEYEVFPRAGMTRTQDAYAAAVRATEETRPLLRELDPDVVVADVLTIAPALAAELEQRPLATLIPHVLQVAEPGFPTYSIGARLPRTPLGRGFWRALDPVVRLGLARGRDELDRARERVGLPPAARLHGGLSRELVLVATFPQLEYPRRAPDPATRWTGPLLWEQPFDEVELPAGDDPLVLIAPSTSQDPDQHMLLAALEGLAEEPVRVLATTNRRPPTREPRVPANAKLVDWVSYAKTMPHCDAVVCHGGHGTVARALACGVPVVCCPAAGDMAENAARAAWAGAGVSLPKRLASPRGVRLAVRRVLGDGSFSNRAAELAAWAERHRGTVIAAAALEELAARSSGGGTRTHTSFRTPD